MSAEAAVNFLIRDHGDTASGDNRPYGFRRAFAADNEYKSILQRNGISAEELLDLFDWTQENMEWIDENAKGPDGDIERKIELRRKICFLAASWRDILEDLEQFDVSTLRSIRTPYVTSRTPLRTLRKEFGGGGE